MGFRARDPFGVGCISGFHPVELVEDVNESGRGLVHLFDPSVATLPNQENFELEALVRAKVPLEKTNTKILGGDSLLVADALADLERDFGNAFAGLDNDKQPNEVKTNE